MQTNVSEQLKESVGSVRAYTFEERDQPLLEDMLYDYTGQATFLRTDRGILVTATIRSTLSGTCSRCVEPLHFPVRVSLEEEFFPTVDILTGLPLPAPSPDAFTIGEDHVLDLSEAVRQYTLVELPIKLLCKPTCAGLCSRCGADLNQGPCGCPREEADQRWSALWDYRRGP